MPIKINGDAAAIAKAAKMVYTPKFFSKDITGNGKVTGMLNQSMFPANIPPKAPENGTSPHWHIRTDVNKHVRMTTYPLNPLGSYAPEMVDGGLNFDANKWCLLQKNSVPPSGLSAAVSYSFYADLTPVSLTIVEPVATAAANTNTTNNITTGKKCTVLYALSLIRVDEDVNGAKTCVLEMITYTENPAATFNNLTLPVIGPSEIAAFSTYLANYNTYYEICRQSEIWQTTIIDKIVSAYDLDPSKFPIGKIIRYISQYKVTLAQYKTLYSELQQRFSAQDLKVFAKMNTNLLLQDTLNNLSQIQFPQLPQPGTTNRQLDLSWCSPEQYYAITSASPLNQVQAGAGTGKSTVIKSRLDYLYYLGIDLNEVMVLSFTNAAADNIKARCPGIQSMTIAKMIDTIYQTNHPTHQLSPSLARRGEGSTFTNSLELYRGSMPLVEELIDATNRVEKNNDYATLLRLVEENYNEIMAILDTVGQTTFHLEIIVCYLEYATMKIPFNIKHLLIDEVQDNAVFEFIFFLNLTCKLQNHLYLVGDCSQTLYEFRASDPKALNAIENSGLFATFPLNINYRSNQNILQFANALLTDIEANQYANIQLQSFTLNQITKQSFAHDVIVDYNRLNKISEMEEWVRRKLHTPELMKWIDDKFAKNEQICVLAYKRRDAAIFQKELEKMYPNKKLVSIIPVKNTAFAYFSKYVSNCRQQLFALPTSSITDLFNRIRAEIIANLNSCHITPTMTNYSKILIKVQTMLADWQTKNTAMLTDKLNLFNSGSITHQELVEAIGESLIDFEIEKNALKQTMLSQSNAAKKEDTDSANFIFSTIHSAKGLEFDNVILLYQNKNQMEEDAKRMYYVALTRAKKCEYILAYDTVLNALVSTRFDTVIQRLPDANVLAGISAAGSTSGAVTDVTDISGLPPMPGAAS